MGLWQSVIPFLEILILAIGLNYVLSFFWNTRSMDLIIGALAFLFIFAFTSLLGLPVLNTIMKNVASVAAIAALVIFHPELRLALYKMSWKGKRFKEMSSYDKFLDHLTASVYRLAEKRVGALIVLEHEDKLDDFAQKAILLNAQFSCELLESIFAPSTPLHDGAVILRDETILAAAVILPLADQSVEGLKATGGTRHRAALGISQTHDSLIIVVSEGTGKVSLARDGVITSGIKPDRFKGIIRSIFATTDEPAFKFQLSLRQWLKT